MSQTQWTPEVRAIWAKLEGFQFDEDDAVFGFEARLAKENGWSREFASRVIQEYRRFLLLAMCAGHPVTPSDEVDQAWHLHLVYTRSYWERLCRDVLGRPLHHEPTKGGVDEGEKFHAQYERTLASYRRLFGEEPPADVWPDVRTCFKPKRHERVDVLRHWTLPKPEWIRRLRPGHVLLVASAMLVAFGVVGCQEINVFDWRGPEFLEFFGIGLLVALLLSAITESAARKKMLTTEPGEVPTDPYEIAFLGGGGRRMVDAAFASLYSRRLLTFETPQNSPAKIGSNEQADDAAIHPVEARVRAALPRHRTAEVRSVREALRPITEEMQQRLASRGLVLRDQQVSYLRFVAAFPMLVMMTAGVVKFLTGLSRGKPVLFLFFGLIVSVIVLALRMKFVQRRTKAGEAAWSQLRVMQPPAELKSSMDFARMEPAAAALAVAMIGSSALATPTYQPLYDTIHRRGAGADSSGGGCGSSGCGSSGCGGGGCGGGGCGGCGGGA